MPTTKTTTPRTARPERLLVKVGDNDVLDTRMTRAQAQRYGDKHMPADLKRAGFETVIFRSDPEIHGGDWFRVNYGMHVGPRHG